jgi:phage tail-like protein
MAIDANQISSLLDSLPAVFQEDRRENGSAQQNEPNFLGRFLLGFEKLLLGLGDPDERGLDEIVANIHRYFEPGAGQASADHRAPKEFLPWLASWLALVLREDLDTDPVLREERQRNLIANASDLYLRRGTKRGIVDYVQSYTTVAPLIEELDTAFQIGVHSTVGEDTLIDGGAPFFFSVTVRIPPARFVADAKKVAEVSRAIIDQQKPAHTYYTLKVVVTSGLQVHVQSTVGVDTILG